MSFSPLRTPHLNLLLDAVSRTAPENVKKARDELEVLKVGYAGEFYNNYCEYYGVPRGSENWNAEEMQAWVLRQEGEEAGKR
jgi:hypothetical protein